VCRGISGILDHGDSDLEKMTDRARFDIPEEPPDVIGRGYLIGALVGLAVFVAVGIVLYFTM